jgi:DNA end-binding protein Ku
MWKGTIAFKGVELPVKIYAALQSRDIHFRLLHDRDHAPVKQKLINPQTGKEVDRQSIRKGAPVAEGRYVLLDDEELASAEPKESREILIEHFVPLDAIDQGLFDRPYWVGPDGSAAKYLALVEALHSQKRQGLARWVMRKREYIGSLQAEEGRLVLVTLRQAAELVKAAELEPPAARKPAAKELHMATQLVEALQSSFDPHDYRDEHHERVMELIRRKSKGQKVASLRPQRKRQPSDLTQALQKSLARVERGESRQAAR